MRLAAGPGVGVGALLALRAAPGGGFMRVESWGLALRSLRAAEFIPPRRHPREEPLWEAT